VTASFKSARPSVSGDAVISVQVLNEFATAASRKLGLSWSEIRDILGPIRTICEIEPLNLETHDRGIELAKRYGFSFFDATIVVSALNAGCKILYSEDFQHDQLIANRLRIRNPFSSS
jgi:predicted nucleic acid-binding protein